MLNHSLPPLYFNYHLKAFLKMIYLKCGSLQKEAAIGSFKKLSLREPLLNFYLNCNGNIRQSPLVVCTIEIASFGQIGENEIKVGPSFCHQVARLK